MTETLAQQRIELLKCRIQKFDPKGELQRAVYAIHEYLEIPDHEGSVYESLLTFLENVELDDTSPTFQSVVMPINRERMLGSPVMNVGIADSEIARSCQIYTFTGGAPNARVRMFFCPQDLFARLRTHPDVDDFEKNHKLPSLQGSPKQVEWARVLRHRSYQKIVDYIADLKSQSPQFAEQLSRVQMAFTFQDNAKDWIETRDSDIKNLILWRFDQVIKIQNKLRELAAGINVSIEDRATAHAAVYPTFEIDRFISWFRGKDEAWQEWAKTKPISELNKIRRVEIGRYLVERPPKDGLSR